MSHRRLGATVHRRLGATVPSLGGNGPGALLYSLLLYSRYLLSFCLALLNQMDRTERTYRLPEDWNYAGHRRHSVFLTALPGGLGSLRIRQSSCLSARPGIAKTAYSCATRSRAGAQKTSVLQTFMASFDGHTVAGVTSGSPKPPFPGGFRMGPNPCPTPRTTPWTRLLKAARLPARHQRRRSGATIGGRTSSMIGVLPLVGGSRS